MLRKSKRTAAPATNAAALLLQQQRETEQAPAKDNRQRASRAGLEITSRPATIGRSTKCSA
jgi:hypothetical protein